MGKKNDNKNVSHLSFNIITAINLIILLRLMFQSIEIDFFRFPSTGKLSQLGQSIKIVQMFIQGITEPFIVPFKVLMSGVVNTPDKELIDILAPIFAIVLLLIASALLKLFMPYINEYKRKKNEY